MSDIERIEIVNPRGEKISVPETNLQWYLRNSWEVSGQEEKDKGEVLETADELDAEEAAGDKVDSEDAKQENVPPEVDSKPEVTIDNSEVIEPAK